MRSSPPNGFNWINGLFLLPALLLLSCGYHLQGQGSNLPADIRSVAIPVFSNRTLQTGVESLVTRSLVEKFTSARRLAVADRESADVVLSGAVQSVDQASVTVTSATQVATGYRVTVTVEFILQRQRDGEILYKQNFSEWRNYNVADDLAITEENKREALRQISQLLAERVHEFILENF